MANIVNPSILAGFMELLPEEQKAFDYIKDIIEDNFKKYGFVNLDTPLIEKEEILLSKGGGETSKQIYRIDKESTPQALRFDLTVSLARYVAMHSHQLAFPFRRYQIGKVYRGERNQKGRYREFYQCDIDIIGNEKLDLLNDAEIPLVIYNIFQDLGLENICFHANNRRLLNGFFESLGIEDKESTLRTIDKILKIGKENTQKELEDIGLDRGQIEEVFNFIDQSDSNQEIIDKLSSIEADNESYKEGFEELETVYQYMIKMGIPEDKIKLDLSITRGLDYYTGTVIETFLEGHEEIGSICSGGRYDDLASNFTKQKFPGIGLSIGLTRLFYQLNEEGLLNFDEDFGYVDVLIIPMGQEDMEYAFEIAEILRDEDIPSQIYFEKGKMKKKFSYADKIDAKYAIVIGEKERQERMISLKNLRTSEQHLIELDRCLEILS